MIGAKARCMTIFNVQGACGTCGEQMRLVHIPPGKHAYCAQCCPLCSANGTDSTKEGGRVSNPLVVPHPSGEPIGPKGPKASAKEKVLPATRRSRRRSPAKGAKHA